MTVTAEHPELIRYTGAAALEDRLPASPPKLHIESLDGLRGVACLLVVALHCWFYSGCYPWPVLGICGHEFVISRLYLRGNVGVDLFFVLSGFCLALPFLKKPDVAWDWQRYLAKRCRRILPPYWIALTVLTLVHVWIESYQIAPFVGQLLILDSKRQLAYTYLMVSSSLNESFWTLPVEWRWYFVLPVLLLIWRRFGMLATAGVCVCCYFASAVIFRTGMDRIEFLATPLPTLLPLFASGIWAADLCSGRALRGWEKQLIALTPIGLSIGVLIWLLFPIAHDGYAEWASRVVIRLPLSFFAVIAAVRVPSIARFFSLKPLRTVGLFSYSFYLIHTPIIQAVYLTVRPLGLRPSVQFLLFQGPVFVLTLLAGYLFFLVAEKPFLERRSK